MEIYNKIKSWGYNYYDYKYIYIYISHHHPWILRHVQMPCVLQHFVSILCYFQLVLQVHVQISGKKKRRLEASNMLGSCCIHDRPDIDTYLAYLDMYTDSYIHIYK